MEFGGDLLSLTAVQFTVEIEDDASRIAKSTVFTYKSAQNIDSDILKVAHHGSKTSSAKEFIAAVSPQFAVISAGRRNRYGHPHEQTLETLNQYGVKVLRTDILGDIKIISDGVNINIK